MILLAVLYLLGVWLMHEGAFAIIKKAITVRELKKQAARIGVKGKVSSLAVENYEKSLLHGMLNVQKAVMINSVALAFDAGTLWLAGEWYGYKAIVIWVMTIIGLVTALFNGNRMARKKHWAIEGCSKLIAMSAAQVKDNQPEMEFKLRDVRQYVDNCQNVTKYKNGVKDKIETAFQSSIEIYK